MEQNGNENLVVWFDDTKTAFPEELEKYTWTQENEQRLKEIVDEAFRSVSLGNEPPHGKPIDSFDVAKYILEKQGTLTAWQLQKLCYYAQAWHYTWTDERLISDDFQAWRNGPVCPKLYALHKGKGFVSVEDIDGNSDDLTADQKDSIDIVLEHYGHLSGDELVNLTHKETPWIKARGDLPPNANSDNIISLESMGEYYRQHLI